MIKIGTRVRRKSDNDPEMIYTVVDIDHSVNLGYTLVAEIKLTSGNVYVHTTKAVLTDLVKVVKYCNRIHDNSGKDKFEHYWKEEPDND